MVWFALTFVTLTAFAGLAIEYNRWQQIATRGAEGRRRRRARRRGLHARERRQQGVRRPRRRSPRRTASPTAAAASRSPRRPASFPNQLKVTVSINTKNPGARSSTTTTRRSCAARWPSTSCRRTWGARRTRYGNDPESAAGRSRSCGATCSARRRTRTRATRSSRRGDGNTTLARRQLQRRQLPRRWQHRLRRQRLLLRHRRAGRA